MLFTTLAFWVFFCIVFCLQMLNVRLWQSVRAQNLLLLSASYLFYSCWDWRFLSLIILSTLVDFIAGLKIERAHSKAVRKRYLWLSIAVNLGMLGLFKYCNFFSAELHALLTSLGYQPSWTALNLVLPVGISFYTFQTMTYTLDIYFGRLKPERQLLPYATYVAFFPQLVAGPIERAANLLPQFQTLQWAGAQTQLQGARLVLFGLFLKIVIADSLAPMVDQIFSDPAAQDAATLWLGALYFAAQIYGDFCGYSTIAIGVAMLMGFQLMTNFRVPYFASSLRDFWQRWHISLSTFFRDYLYIPLGGNRGSTANHYRNLLITFTTSGIWHGANWTFLLWGFGHGCAMIAEHWLGQRIHLSGWAGKLTGWFATLLIVLIGWVIFRSETIADAGAYLRRMVTELPTYGNALTEGIPYLALLAFIDLLWHRDTRLDGDHFAYIDRLGRFTPYIHICLYSAFFWFSLRFALNQAGAQPFIYFQF